METEEYIKNYVKDNNIKGYLSVDLDKEELLKHIDKEDFEEERANNENIESEEDYIYNKIATYNLELALENEDIEELLYYIYNCDFNIEINKNGILDIIDMQGAYLGGEDSWENFDTISSAFDRISGAYLYDYFGITLY